MSRGRECPIVRSEKVGNSQTVRKLRHCSRNECWAEKVSSIHHNTDDVNGDALDGVDDEKRGLER